MFRKLSCLGLVCLILPLAACGAGGGDAGPTPTPTGNTFLGIEEIQVRCTETQVEDWLQDTDNPQRIHGRIPLNSVEGQPLFWSDDYGESWRRVPVVVMEDVRAASGNMALTFSRPGQNEPTQWLATADQWQTIEQPVFYGIDGEDFPPESGIATLAGGQSIVVTPSGRTYFKEGSTWHSPPDAFAAVESLGRYRSAYGDIEVVSWQDYGQILAVSSDGGFTWASFGFDRTIDQITVTANGSIVAGWALNNEDQGLMISHDLGETWALFPGFRPGFAVGPGAGEIWAGDVPDPNDSLKERIWHSVNGGLNWSEVHVNAGDGPLDLRFSNGPLQSSRVFQDGDGKMVLNILRSIHPSQPLRCVEASSGALDLVPPTRNDTPGSVTLWAYEEVTQSRVFLPGLNPGEAIWPDWTRTPDLDQLGPVTGLDWSADKTEVLGVAASALDKTIPRDDYATLFTVDPATGAIKTATAWDTFGIRTSTGIEVSIQDASNIRAFPNGRVEVSIYEGRVPVTDTLEAPVPLLHSEVDANTEVAMIPLHANYYGELRASYWYAIFAWDGAVCIGSEDVDGCKYLEVGELTDYVVSGGIVYALDRMYGHLWALESAADVPPKLVAEGFLHATNLWASMAGDAGIYVYDDHIYRVVPGDNVGVRP